MRGMIHHHAQALVMSEHAPRNGAGPSVSRLAARIMRSQQDEIVIMRRWLLERGLPAPDPASSDTRSEGRSGEEPTTPRPTTGHPPGHHMAGNEEHLMPGMLSAEQLRELGEAKGLEFDRLFLFYMIMHHQGAVTMVDELFSTYGAGQDHFVFRLAADIRSDQVTEIARMRSMLDDLSNNRRDRE